MSTRGKRIYIVGSGPSALHFDFDAVSADDIVFGVNGTLEWLSRLDWWFTLDQSPKNLIRLRNPRPGVSYFAALPDNVSLPDFVTRYIRRAVGGRNGSPKTKPPRQRHTPLWWMWRWSATQKLSTLPGVVNTGNSMWGALQIAFQHGFKEIVLVGLDGTRENKIEGGKPHSLSHLPILFASAVTQLKAAGVQVWNANPGSRVTCFPAFNYEEALTA